jgi:hypothetical protein
MVNVPNRAADVKSKDTVCTEVHPASFAVTIAYTKRIRAPVMEIAPK